MGCTALVFVLFTKCVQSTSSKRILSLRSKTCIRDVARKWERSSKTLCLFNLLSLWKIWLNLSVIQPNKVSSFPIWKIRKIFYWDLWTMKKCQEWTRKYSISSRRFSKNQTMCGTSWHISKISVKCSWTSISFVWSSCNSKLIGMFAKFKLWENKFKLGKIWWILTFRCMMNRTLWKLCWQDCWIFVWNIEH